MIRPKVLYKTYSSLKKYVTDLDFKNTELYINIDPLPNNKDPTEVVKVAKSFFGKVIFNIPEKANFPSALNWLWSQTDSDFIFHLEDDWEFVSDISIKKMLKCFKSDIEMVQLKRKSSAYQGMVGLTPCIMSKRFYKNFAGNLKLDRNPEMQIMQRVSKKYIPKENESKLTNAKVYVFPTKSYVVKDIGREWLKKSKYSRPAYSDFVSWSEK
jgi:hypothetical protein